MKKWLFAGLAIAIAAVALWWAMGQRSVKLSVPQVQQAPARPVFHVSKPLRVEIRAAGSAENQWLERELRYLLMRGKMRVATIAAAKDPDQFLLRIDLAAQPQAGARLALVAGDGVTERTRQIEVASQSRLATVQSIAQALPAFLGATHSHGQWQDFIGTADVSNYEAFLRSTTELLGAGGSGFTQSSAAQYSQTVERLEALTRKDPRFARAWSALALGYLGLGGEDDGSLTELSEAAAARAAKLDEDLADTQAALGLIRLHRNEWALAREHFQMALAMDPNSAPALEGLACLLVDVGHSRAAVPIATRAIALQPKNIGAHEALTFARLSMAGTAGDLPEGQPFAAARVRALVAVLANDIDGARRILRSAQNAQNSPWIEPVLRAAEDRGAIVEALRTITRAANAGQIDAASEILGGAALKQADFVFNRMLRLQKRQQSMPLRLLWLREAAYLRTHARFEELVNAAGLPSFWQDHGAPDVCEAEPRAPWCKVKSAQAVSAAR